MDTEYVALLNERQQYPKALATDPKRNSKISTKSVPEDDEKAPKRDENDHPNKIKNQFYYAGNRVFLPILLMLPAVGAKKNLSVIIDRKLPQKKEHVTEQVMNRDGNFWPIIEREFYPWSNTESCSKFYNTFSPPKSRRLVALASSPGSGNSWFRYMLDGASGLFTGSIYYDGLLYKKGMYGERSPYASGMVIAVKTHESHGKENAVIPERYHRGIVLIRNPFEAIISFRNYLSGGLHLKVADTSKFFGQGWTGHVQDSIKYWRNLNTWWLSVPKSEDLYIILYEFLKLEPLKYVKESLQFLELPVNSRRMECVSKHFEGELKRTPRNLPDPFTPPLKEIVYEAIDAVNEALFEKMNKTLPVHLYKFYNATEAETARKRRLKKTKKI